MLTFPGLSDEWMASLLESSGIKADNDRQQRIKQVLTALSIPVSVSAVVQGHPASKDKPHRSLRNKAHT